MLTELSRYNLPVGVAFARLSRGHNWWILVALSFVILRLFDF